MLLRYFCLFFLLLCATSLRAQEDSLLTPKFSPTEGAIRGRILDRNSKMPLRQGFVELLNFSPPRLVPIDSATGRFLLSYVPVGRHRLIIRSQGYEDGYETDINVVAGKTEVLTIELTEKLRGMDDPLAHKDIGDGTTLVVPIVEKNPFILMDNTIGEHRFSTDEVNRFSGGRNDPARLATSFAGVANSDDTRNDLIVRGASPLGLQWVLEGLPIQNPNHLGHIGTTSGFFPMLNINTIETSDFRLGCFSAQYANSTTGIFDLHLRTGSQSEQAYSAQLSLNGGEVMVESPLFKKRGSMLVALRYSALRLFNLLPSVFRFNAETLPNTYDANFNFQYLSPKLGEFTLFGFYGKGSFQSEGNATDLSNVFAFDPNADVHWEHQNGFMGLKHRYFFSDNAFWQTTLGANIAYSQQTHLFPRYESETGDSIGTYKGLNSKVYQASYSLNTFLNTKVNSQLSWRTGMLLQLHRQELYELSNRYNIFPNTRYDYRGLNGFLQVYAHFNWRLHRAVNLQLGALALYQSINSEWAAAPRFSLSIDLHKRHQLDLIYTLQQQQISPRIVFLQFSQFDALSGSTQYDRGNQQLPMMGNHYLMMEYAYQPSSYWQIKVSPYFRSWFRLPVQANALSGYSLYNADGSLPFLLPNFPLQSTGRALNYGIDLSAQQHFYKGFQFISSASYFRSLYAGSDGVMRPSRFDRNWLARLSLVREFTIGKKKRDIFFLSTTFNWADGERYTPIDRAQSLIFQNEVLTQDWYSLRTPDYMRWDFKLGFRFNRRRLNHYFYIDVMNLTNRRNVLTYRYDLSTQQIAPVYQYGRLPELFYRIQF